MSWATAWRIARRELDWRFRGLRLLLVCLVLGVGALAAIGSLADAVGRELAARGATILGGDVEFAVSQRQLTPEELGTMARLGGARLGGVTARSWSMQASAVSGDAIVPATLKAVDARYPLYGRLTLTDGRSVGEPADDAAWASPALMQRLGVRVGQPVRLGSAAFRIAGVIGDEPDRLGEGFTLGPVVIVSRRGLDRTALVQPGSMYESRLRVRLPGGASPDAAVTAVKRAHPVAGIEARTRDRASPGASRFVERMGQFLSLVGLSALIIAGIGIGGGVSSYLRARRRSIAMLKVMGATSALVLRVYLLQIGAVAAAGIALGLAIGAGAVPLLVALAGRVLPVSPQFAVEAAPLARAAAYGLLVALGFSAGPLLAAGAVPAAGLLRGDADARAPAWRRALPWSAGAIGLAVALALWSSDRPALAAGFLGAVAGVLALLAGFGWATGQVAARLPRPRAPLARLALAALHRPGARTTSLVVALGLGLTLFVLLAAIRTSIDANIQRTVPQRAPALFALDVPRDREGEFRRVVAATAPGAVVATVPALRGTITGYGRTRVANLRTLPEGAWALRGERGLTYAETLPAGSEVAAGRWWPRGYAGPPLVSVDERLADVLDLKLGDPLTVSLLGVERTARIASFRRIHWDTLGFNYVLVFSPNAIRDAPHNLAATIEMPPARAGAVVRALSGPFPSTSVIEVGGVLAQVRDVVGQMATAIAAAAGVAVAAGIAVLVGAVAAAREARTYDAVVLRTLGATRAQVLGGLALEYLLLAGAVALLAFGLGTAGAWYVVVRLFQFEWLPSWPAIGATLVAGAGLTTLLGLAGAWQVLGVRPAQALRAV